MGETLTHSIKVDHSNFCPKNNSGPSGCLRDTSLDLASDWLRDLATHHSFYARSPKLPAVAVSSLRDGDVASGAAPPEQVPVLAVSPQKLGHGQDPSQRRTAPTTSLLNQGLKIAKPLRGRQSIKPFSQAHGQIEGQGLIAPCFGAVRGIDWTLSAFLLLGVQLAAGGRTESLVATKPKGRLTLWADACFHVDVDELSLINMTPSPKTVSAA